MVAGWTEMVNKALNHPIALTAVKLLHDHVMRSDDFGSFALRRGNIPIFPYELGYNVPAWAARAAVRQHRQQIIRLGSRETGHGRRMSWGKCGWKGWKGRKEGGGRGGEGSSSILAHFLDGESDPRRAVIDANPQGTADRVLAKSKQINTVEFEMNGLGHC